MRSIVNLDAARAARAEARADEEPVGFEFGGRDFVLPAELPASAVFAASDGNVKGLLEMVLGDQADEFWALDPSADDLMALGEAIPAAYGLSAGESEASDAS